MRWLSWLLVVVVMVGSTSLWAVDGVLPGGGTEGDPYLIEDLADFDVFADSVNAATYWASGVYTRLACDPNMAGRTYTTAVIAPDTDNIDWEFNGMPFEGIFDGDGLVISNLTIDTLGAGNNYLGLFGAISGAGSEVKNLGVKSVTVRGANGSGGLGGLCGWNQYGRISNCYSSGVVTGGYTSSRLGGLCGENQGIIDDCYSSSSVTGTRNVGGLCGNNGSGSISKCYSSGQVTGSYAGGLCGFSGRPDQIVGCFWDVETSGMATSDGGMGLPTVQMQTLSTFVDAGWDFIKVWNIGENQTYPYIRTYWAADINKDRAVNVIDLSIMGEEWMGQ